MTGAVTFLVNSNATGVNGNQADNSAGFAGAVYTFSGVGTNSGVINAFIQGLSISGGEVALNFSGVPGAQYDIQRATDLGGPWTNLDTLTAPVDGFFGYTNSSFILACFRGCPCVS